MNSPKPTARSVAIIGTRGYPSYYGGFETAVRALAPQLADHGWDVTVYGRRDSVVVDDSDRDDRVHSVLTRGLDSKSLSTLTHGFTAVLHAMRRRPQVALVMNVANGFWLFLLRLRGIPILTNVDGMEWEREKWGRLAKAVFKTGARLTARFSNGIVVDSREIGRRWHHDFGRDGTYIAYGGTRVDQALPIEPGLEHGGYALLVARLVPENTVPEFVEAIGLLPPGLPVVIVGSSGYGGDLEQAVRTLAENDPRVRWLGHVNDDDRLLSLWQHAGAYFHGHSVGGTNPALVQAMACGAPIVARDTVYNREVLGDAGVYVTSAPAAIAAGIAGLLDDADSRARLGAAAKARAATEFTWERICDDYEAALDELRRR